MRGYAHFRSSCQCCAHTRVGSTSNNIHTSTLFVDQAPMLYSVVCMHEACRGHPRCVRQIVPFEVALTYLPFPVSTALDPVI